MSWESPFIIYRINEYGKLEEVYCAKDLKQARYWLTYIAEPGDVCCRTPIHPKHSQSQAAPEYWSHKEQSGKASSKQDEWVTFAEGRKFDFTFPEQQYLSPKAD